MVKLRVSLGPDDSVVIPEAVREALALAAGDSVEFELNGGACRLRKAEEAVAEPLLRELELVDLDGYWLPVEFLYYSDGCRAVCREPAVTGAGPTKSEALSALRDRVAGILGQ